MPRSQFWPALEILCALFLAANEFMAAGFAGMAATCALVIVGGILIRHDRATWSSRLESPQARVAVNVLSVAVIACFVTGLVLNLTHAFA